MIETAATRIIDSGVLGAMLFVIGALLFYTVRRFIEFLERADSRHIEERTEWKRSIDEHTAASKEINRTLHEMYEYLRKQNGKT